MSTTKNLSFCFAIALVVTSLAGIVLAKPTESKSSDEKQVIGPIAMVEEAESDLEFPARVDTGATTTSIHAEAFKVKNEADEMEENVGKTIRFKIKNQRGESEWLERKIAEISTIKTSEREETRYKVPITLNYKDVKKRVLVSLNDRSHMKFPVLLGRNFLQGDFVVDVDLNTKTPGEKAAQQSEAAEDTGAKDSKPAARK